MPHTVGLRSKLLPTLTPITAAAAVRKAAVSTCGTAIRLVELKNTSDRLVSSTRPRAGLILKPGGCCIHELAARMKPADSTVPTAAAQMKPR